MTKKHMVKIVIETRRKVVISARRVVRGSVVGTEPSEAVVPPLARIRRSRADKTELSQKAFTSLLLRLDSDWDRAGEKLMALRLKLTKFFECRGCVAPGDLADETINRAAHRIYCGEQIRADDLQIYFYGVARNVLREYYESCERRFLTLDELVPNAQPEFDPWLMDEQQQARARQERLIECLETCLQELPAESRGLLLEYYVYEDGKDRIRRRREMAERLGVSVNALKIRLHRIRESLEQLMLRRLAQETDFESRH